ncbi:MAG TPA: diadenylate cyclase CdaA [Candidatus Brocadiia bacterium]|nr:diadenylate cyclase CdaA [Candidatus Brocadiia bacterium]
MDWVLLGKAVIEIAIIALVVYAVLQFLQGTRGAGVLRGLVFTVAISILTVLFVVDRLALDRLRLIMDPSVLIAFLLPIMVLFQPEFRRVLVRLGEAPMFRWLFKTEPVLAASVIRAAEELSKHKFGALIAIEGEVGLGTYVEGGVRLDAEVTTELLVAIFWPGAPLHDGAVVIRGNRIAAAGCLFPLTENPSVSRNLGTRHRAAIGVTEESDAVALVVSEETREVSIAYRGRLIKNLDRAGMERVFSEIAAESRGWTGAEGHKNAKRGGISA